MRRRPVAQGAVRSDLVVNPSVPLRQHIHLQQRIEDLCKGCCIAFPFRNFTVDNIVLRSRGGTDHPDNLQLLCAACNGLKGNRTQTELIAALWRNGIIDSKKETAIITNPKIARGEDQNQQAGYSSLQAPTFRQQHQKSVVCRQ